jgi:hypothetical protein
MPVSRSARLRSPLVLLLGALLAFEAIGGMVIFVARLVAGQTPGELLHVAAGIAITIVYAIYQWLHWNRVAPFRMRLDYSIGLLAALSMVGTNVTGLVLGWSWWLERVVRQSAADVDYAPLLSAAHNIGSMLVLTFVAGHVGAVMLRSWRLKAGD